MFGEVDKLYILFDADGRPYVKGLREMERETDRSGRRMESDWGKYGKKAGQAVAAGLAFGTVAAVAAGKAIVGVAASFEYEFSRIKANANASAAEIDALRKLTLQLGKDTAFSAGEAAQGANELVKAGMDIADVMAALPGMLDLAAAGELGVAQAAEITANQLNTFKLAAKDATMVADTLAAAANKSTTDVTDLGMSLSMSATVAASAGLTIQETAAALALLANNGLKGSDAGTSLKSMFMQLAAPAAKARDLMDKYGIAVYDANGDMLEFADIIGNVSAALSPLTQEERDFGLATIFGSDAVRTANILVREGEQAYRDMTDAVSETGTAQDVAATKMDNLKGSWEELKGSLETLAIEAGSKALPQLRKWVDSLTDTVDEAMETGDWTKVGGSIAKMVGEGIESVTPYIAQLAAEVVPQLFTGAFQGAAEAWWAAFDDAQKDSEERRRNNPLNLGYVDTAQIVRDVDMAVREYGRLVRQADELDEAWIRTSHQTAAATEGVADYTDNLAVAAEQAELVAQYTETLASLYASEVNPAQVWKDAEGSLSSYLTKLDEQIAAWADFETNLGALASKFGPEFGADVIMKAAEVGPDFVAALVGSDPETVHRALTGLQTTMGQNMDAMATRIAALSAPVGEQSSEAMMKAWWANYSASIKPLPVTFKRNVSVDLSAEGEAAGNSYVKGVKKAFGVGVSLSLGISPAGGAEAGLDLLTGKVSGLASSTANVWTTLKSIYPYAQWAGGYATSGHVKGSDHYTGHAFDVSGTPAQMRAMANALARNFDSWGLKQIIHNRQQYRGGGWYPYNGANPHTGHIHVSTYGMGGWVLPPAQRSTGQEVPAVLHAGEYVLTQNQAAAMFAGAPSYATGGWVMPEGGYDSYIDREAARYSMYGAQAGDFIDLAELATLTQTLARQIEFLDLAIAEAQKTLDEAKAKGNQGQINEAAQALFALTENAAEARREMEQLARTPLEQAASRWASALRQTESMMSLVSNSSNATALQSALMPTLMGQMGAGYQTSLDLMGKASGPEQVMGYANDAIGSLSSMFGAEQNMVNRALSDTLSSIDSQQAKWEASWNAQASAMESSISRQQDALNDQLETLQRTQQAELESLAEHYDAKLQALRDGETAITREQQRNAAMKRVGGLEDELRILQGQGYYTEADIQRMRELETQIQEGHDSAAQKEAAWAREDEIARLEREKQEALKSLQQQQESQRIALQDQVEAQQRALEAQRQAFQQQAEQQRLAFEQQREQARQAAQAEIDQLVTKYQAMMQEVINRQNELLGQAWDYQNAGYTLGVEFANGLLASLPAITAAAQTIASQVSDILKLNSPAKVGPLSDLDHWWDAFMPTLVKPLDTAAPAVSDLAASVRSGVVTSRGEEHIYVHLDGNAAGLDIDTLADKVGRAISRKVDIARYSHGS